MDSLVFLNILLLITFLAPQALETNLGEGNLLKIQCVTALLLIGLYVWQSWRTRVHTSPEPEVIRKYGRLIGEPRFDPYAGIVATALIDGKTCEILLQPKWWNLLGGTAINKSPQETVVDDSPVSTVPVGKEPGSLVCLQREDGVVVGMATRVKTGSRTVLLTAFHVLKKYPDVYICKNGERVKIERDWESEAWCADASVDLLAIRVPVQVWSKLGVSSASTKNLRGCVPVTCYGASSSKTFMASTGMATYTKGLTIRHNCSTIAGWSGSPLYHKGAIVGLHRGFHEVGVSNNATVVEAILATTESPLEEGNIREIDEAEGEFRTGFVEYEIGGRGTYSVGESEFFRLKNFVPKSGVRWADIADETSDEFWDTMETIQDEPLNGLEAVSECSPPSLELGDMSGKNPSVSQAVECPSMLLGDRVCVLEKLVEQLILSSSQMLELASQNSKILAGLNAERVRNLIPSSSKPADSERLKNPQTSKSVLIGSVPVTLKQNPVLNSVDTTGRKKTSRRRRKKSASEASTVNPLPVSPLLK